MYILTYVNLFMCIYVSSITMLILMLCILITMLDNLLTLYNRYIHI